MYGMEDPFDKSKNNLEDDLETLKQFVSRFKQLANQPKKKEEVEFIREETKKYFKNMKVELIELSKSIIFVEKNREKFPQLVEKLPERRAFVNRMEKNLEVLQEEVKRREIQFKKTGLQRQKEVLFGNYTKKNNPYQELEELNQEENQNFIENEFRKQDQIEKKTILGVKKITRKVEEIKDKALVMGDEVQNHKKMLGDLKQGVEDTDNLIQRTTKRIKDLAKKSGNWGKIGCIIFLIVILVVLVILLFSVNF